MINKTVLGKKLAEIVKYAETSVLPTLQLVNPEIVNINYVWGSAEEISEKLKAMATGDTATRAKVWPAVIFPGDIMVKQNAGGYAGNVVIPNIGIVYPSGIRKRADKRYTDAIEPILTPIYEALLHAIMDSGVFVLYQSEAAASKIPHEKVEVIDFPSKYVVSDCTYAEVDAVFIRRLELTISNVSKLKPITEIEGII